MSGAEAANRRSSGAPRELSGIFPVVASRRLPLGLLTAALDQAGPLRRHDVLGVADRLEAGLVYRPALAGRPGQDQDRPGAGRPPRPARRRWPRTPWPAGP